MKFLVGGCWIGSLMFALGIGYNLAAGGPTPLGTKIGLIGFVICSLFGTIALILPDTQTNIPVAKDSGQ